jgi:hypothetical protein
MLRGAEQLRRAGREAVRSVAVVAAGGLVLGLLAVTPAAAESSSLMPVALSEAGGMASRPDVAVDAQGDAIAIWERNRTGVWETQSAVKAPGGTWQPAVSLSAGYGQRPRIAMDPKGDAVALWERGGPGESIEASARPAGGAWQAAQTISAAGATADFAQIALDGEGGAVAVWQQHIGPGAHETIQAAVLPAGGAWQAPVTVSSEGEDASRPRVSVDSKGDAVVVWQRHALPNNSLIQGAFKPAGGVWQSQVNLTAESEIAFEPVAAIDAGGNVVAVWEHYDGTDLIIQSAERPAGGLWQPAVNLSAAGQNAVHPQVGMDPQGDAIAVWPRNNGSNVIIQGAVRPAGSSWQAAVDLSEGGQSAFEAHVAVDSHGDALAVWERSNGSRMVIQGAARPAGGPWQPAADLSGGGGSQEPNVALGSHGAAAVWLSWNGSEEIAMGATDESTPPLLQSLSIPTTGSEGQPVAFSVSPLDPWSALGPTKWSFGDGSTTTGTSVTHTYAATGAYEVVVQSENVLGNNVSTSGTITISTPPVEHAEYRNWLVAGALTPSKLRKPLALLGATFNGAAQVNSQTGAGTITGRLSFPPFTVSLGGHNDDQLKLRMSITQVGSLEGVLVSGGTAPGDETLTIPLRLSLAVTPGGPPESSAGASCRTAEPISLALVDTLTREQVLRKGWSFTGTATVPRFKCQRGGGVSAALLTKLLSGRTAYTLTVRAPA